MATQSTKPLALRPRDAAKSLGISPRTLWGLTTPRGPIPCLRIGHGNRQTVLYPVADLQAWLSQQAEAEKGATSTGDCELCGQLPPEYFVETGEWAGRHCCRACWESLPGQEGNSDAC